MTSRKPYPGTQAVVRALSLLKAFTDERPSWSLSALAEMAGLNKTTTYRLLTALESEGLVARNGGDTYRLGPEIVVLGGRALRQNDIRRLARPYLNQLAADTGETASLDILVDDDILIIDEVIGDYLVGSVSSLGTRHPAFATSTGKAMMAHLPTAVVAEMLSQPLPQITPKTIVDPARIEEQLARIRQMGYAVADEELEVGLVVVGAAVYDLNGEVNAAISLGGPTLRFTPERIAEIGDLLRETAVQLSTRLGYRI